MKEKMYTVICGDESTEFDDLAAAMNYAKETNMFVTIKGNGYEIVGVFGVDNVELKDYHWKKRRK
jgi:hypothetical protein